MLIWKKVEVILGIYSCRLLILVPTDSSLMVLQYNKTATFVFVSPSLIKQTVIIISPWRVCFFSFCSVIWWGGGPQRGWFLGCKNTAIKKREDAASKRWKELIIVMKQRWPLTISWLLMYVFTSCCTADPYFLPLFLFVVLLLENLSGRSQMQASFFAYNVETEKIAVVKQSLCHTENSSCLQWVISGAFYKLTAFSSRALRTAGF